MRMYEAMRLGAMLGPQAFNFSQDSYGGTCARMAALKAIGEPWGFLFGFEASDALTGGVDRARRRTDSRQWEDVRRGSYLRQCDGDERALFGLGAVGAPIRGGDVLVSHMPERGA